MSQPSPHISGQMGGQRKVKPGQKGKYQKKMHGFKRKKGNKKQAKPKRENYLKEEEGENFRGPKRSSVERKRDTILKKGRNQGYRKSLSGCSVGENQACGTVKTGENVSHTRRVIGNQPGGKSKGRP